MLVLSRNIGESFTVNGNIRITVLSHERGRVRLSIDAPREVPVVRDDAKRTEPPAQPPPEDGFSEGIPR